MAIIKLKGRAGFLDIFEPASIQGSAPSYGMYLIVDPNDKAQCEMVEDEIDRVCEEAWGKQAETIRARCEKAGDYCWTEGYQDKDGNDYAGFEGMMALRLKSPEDQRPTVVDRDRTPLTAKDGRIYPGCYVVAHVEIWAQDNKWGRGVRGKLKGVQFVEDGEAFSGSAPVKAEDFDDLSNQGDAPRRSRRGAQEAEEEPQGRRGRRAPEEDEAPARGRRSGRDEARRSSRASDNDDLY